MQPQDPTQPPTQPGNAPANPGTAPAMQPAPAPMPTPTPATQPVQPAQPIAPPAPGTPISALASPTPISTPSPGTLEPNQGEESSDEAPRKSALLVALGFIFSWIVIPGLLVLAVHYFVFQAWYVDGQSMEPTFHNGDYLIVSKWETSYKKLLGQASNINIKRGDVVIFNPPGYTSEIFFIKRAIALQGERVVIKNGTITIYNTEHPEGFILNEPYTDNIKLEGDIDRTVEPGYLFVVGDNRNPNASHDSRAIGPIPLDRVIGTADLRLLPVSQFGQIEHPTYDSTITPGPTPIFTTSHTR